MGFSLDNYIKEQKQQQKRSAEGVGPYNAEQDRAISGGSGSFSLDAYMEGKKIGGTKTGGARNSGPGSFQESIQPAEAVRPMRTSAPTPPPETPEMDEKEALHRESRYRTQLAKGARPEELAVKEAVRDAGFRAGRLGGEVKELEKQGQQLLLLQQELTGQDAAELSGQIMENGRTLEEKRAEKRKAKEEKETLVSLLTPPEKSPYSDLTAQQLKTLQEHAEISLRMAEKALKEAGMEEAGADPENIPAWARPGVTVGATARGAYTPKNDHPGEKAENLVAERDRWQGIVNDIGQEYYYRQNEEQAAKLAGDTEGQAGFRAVEDILADIRTLGDVAAGESETEESARARAALREKYGLTERELEVEATSLLSQLQGELETAKEAVGAAGYDYDKMTAYQERLAQNERAAEGQRNTVKYAHEHPRMASAESTLATPAQMFDYIGMALKGIGHSDPTDLDNYIPANAYDAKATNFVRNVRGTVAADWAEKYGLEIGGTNIAAFLYQTGMSMSDFLYNAMLTGNFTGGWGTGTELGKKAAENLSLAIMGSGAAANTTVEAIERGLSNRQAYALGAIAGIAEIVTEKVSLETLLDKTAMDKSAWGYIVKNVLAEGSEEVASDLINWAGDVLVSRDRSEWAQAIQAYMDQDMDEREAFLAALKDQVISMGWSGLGGGLSGGLMAGSGVAVNEVTKWANGKSQGRPAEDSGTYIEEGAGRGQTAGVDGQVRAVMEALVEQGDGRTDAGKVMEALGKLTQAGQSETELWDSYDRLMGSEFEVGERGEIFRREQTAQAEQNPEIAWKQLDMLKRSKDSFGPSGQKALTAVWEQGGDPGKYYGGFTAYYDAGVAGIPQEKVRSSYAGNLTEAQKYAAYVSGQNDAAAEVAERKSRADFASVAGKDSGLVYDDYVRENMDLKDFRRLNQVLKQLETRAYFVDKVGDGVADGAIAPGDSDILLSKEMTDREIRVKVAGHELGHRIRDLAPEAYQGVQTAMVEALGEEELSIRTETMFRTYQEKGLERTSVEILEEVTNDYIGELTQDGAALDAFLAANKAPEKRSVLEWLRDAIRGLIQKLTGKETREEVRKLSEAEQRLTAALEEAEAQAKKLSERSGGKKTATSEGDGGVRYAIKEEDVQAVQAIGRKSVNEFTSEEIKATEAFAQKYWQEMGEKSPFFRAWFGDWRVNDQTPVEVVKVEEGLEYKAGKERNEDTGMIISWGEQFKSETKVHDNGGDVLDDTLANVRDIVKKAILLDTEASSRSSKRKMKQTAFMHAFYAIVDDGKGPSLYRLYAEEALNSKKEVFTRAYELKYMEKVIAGGKGVLSQKEGLTQSRATTSEFSVADLFRIVKEKKSTFQPKEASKVVNEEGKPLVVYHGTWAEPFTVFDKNRLGENTDWNVTDPALAATAHIGFWFNTQDLTGRAGSRAEAVYLNMENPYQIDSLDMLAAEIEEAGGADAFVEWMKEQGYDGAEVRDEEFGGTSYVVLEPEQIKSATDNVGTFDGKDQDIRFSLKSGEGLREMVELRRENEKLKDQVEYWRGQTRYTKELTPRAGDVKKAAKELIGKYQSALKAEDIFGDVAEIWKALNDERNRYETVKELARPLAQKLVESAVAEAEGPGKDYRDAAEYLKKTKLRVPRELWSEMESKGGYGEFRQENFGRLKLSSKDGTPIDVAYKEMAQKWPGLFDEVAYSTQGDQLVHMAEVAQALKPVWENPYGDILDAATEEAATDIVSAIMDGTIRRTPETMADRMNRTIQENRREHWEGRKKDAARITEAYREIRKRDARNIARHFAELDAKKRASREKTETRTRIYKVAQELTRRVLQPTDAKHVPQDFRRPLAAVLATLDLGSGYDMNFARSGNYERVARDSVLGAEKTRKTTKFEEIQVELAKLGGGSTRAQALAELNGLLSGDGELTVDPDLTGPDGWIQELIRMGDKPVDAMTGEELRTVNRAMVSIAKAVSEANNMLSGSRWKTVSEAAEEIRRENRGKKERVTRTGIAGKAQGLEMGMLTPEAFFHRLGSAGDELFRQLRKAQDKQITILSEVAERAKKLLEGYDVRKAEETIHDVDGVKVSTAQIINLYNLSQRKQALDHIGKGGVKPEGAKGEGKMLTYAQPIRDASLGWIGEAISRLTDEDIRVAKGMQEIMATILADYGNEASMEVFGFKKFEEADYWPIKVNGNELNQTTEQKTQVKTPANYGMTKQTQPKAANSVKLGSAFDVFAEHTTEMSTYAAFLAAMEDLRRIRNYQFTVQREDGSWESTGENMGSILERVMGKDGQKYWDGLMEQLAVGVKGQKVGRNYTGALMGNFKASAIGANIRVFLQQPTAIIRAADMINPAYLARGAANPMKGWNKALQYAPIAKWKDWGYYDVAAGRQIKDVMFETDTAAQKVTNALMAPAGWMDGVAWGQLWNAVELETRADHKELKVGSPEYYDHVADRFASIIDHSQVVDGILQRSQMMRDPDGLAKMATSFMSEPVKQANMVMSAVYDVQNAGDPAEKAEAKKRLVRTGMAMGACIIVNGAVKSIVDAMRSAKDDRDKMYWERWLEALGENLKDDVNPITYIPYVKDVWSLIQGYDVERTDMSVMADLVDGTKAMVKALKGEGKRTVVDTVTAFAAAMAAMTGLPAGNIKRDLLGLVNTLAVETDNYVMQYEMDRMIYRPTENKTRNMDVLWAAFRSDRDQYKIVLDKMREDGISEDYIQENMVGRAAKELDALRVADPKEYERLYQEFIRAGIPKEKLRTRLENMRKKAEGVDSVEDLSSRYLMPDQEAIYDAAIRQIQESYLWGRASGEQRKDTEADLFAIASGSRSGEEILERAAKQGMDETEYLLYQLALSMVDQPNANGNLGTYTKEEKEKALRMLEGN